MGPSRLINALRDILDENSGYEVKNSVEVIKSQFYKILGANLEAAKKKFIDEGGVEEEFVPEEDPYEADIKNLLKQYRYQRIEYNKRQEHVKEDNLNLKYRVIEEIKLLINKWRRH